MKVQERVVVSKQFPSLPHPGPPGSVRGRKRRDGPGPRGGPPRLRRRFDKDVGTPRDQGSVTGVVGTSQVSQTTENNTETSPRPWTRSVETLCHPGRRPTVGLGTESWIKTTKGWFPPSVDRSPEVGGCPRSVRRRTEGVVRRVPV